MPENTKKAYSEEKMKRIAAGATVAGVLLGLFLIVILVIQFVQIGVRNAERARLNEGIGRYQEIIEHDKKILEDYLEGDALYYEALRQGWRTP